MSSQTEPRLAVVAGSILVAALSSACCWLPLVAVALGFSAVGVGSMFEGYRWPLVGLAVGLIVGGLALQRRQRRSCERDGCPPPSKPRLLMPLAGGVLVVAFAVFPEILAWTASEAAEHAGDPANAALTRSYAVTGMTCEGCTGLLGDYLRDQPEIVGASVSYAEATARVEFVAGTTAAQADEVMARVSVDWEGSYVFTVETTP